MHEIRIEHFMLGSFKASPEDMASLAGSSFKIANRVPDTEGEAFDWQLWYAKWVEQASGSVSIPAPTHLIVEAADTFEALIPWEELGDAAVLYALEGQRLSQTGPIRLYVPNGSSKCLNVKSIVKLSMVKHNAEAATEKAAYGFKNTFSVNELRKNK
ncbi:hypothetical protein AB4Z29_19775 [Paenibacillus sp. 2TAB23]|uniref:hypothetical protein n=1 Tax=Paenibacillus sp. 2TAB23 TaxID=3233004 RepID=UPI003F9B70F1